MPRNRKGRREAAGRSGRGEDRELSPHERASLEREAAGILEGQRVPEAHRLFVLIHAVNPSQRALPDRERQRLYALKSRLQSLLVDRFRDALEVEPVAGKPHLVSLRHRFSSRDACHALIDSLAPKARYWVESELGRSD